VLNGASPGPAAPGEIITLLALMSGPVDLQIRIRSRRRLPNAQFPWLKLRLLFSRRAGWETDQARPSMRTID
jgi:hypothetical protein